MKKLNETSEKELLNKIEEGDTYNIEAMKEYFERKCIEYEYLSVDQMYEEICEREGL